MTDREQEFMSILADALEVPALAPEEDYRTTRLWGSLTAFSLKVSIQQKYGRSITLGELGECASAAELMARVLS